MASAEQVAVYRDLYNYLSTRNRCGVMSSFCKTVKDMYVVPLAAQDALPTPLLPFDGPGKDIYAILSR